MLLYGLEKDQDFQYLDARLLVSCPASGPDEGGLFLLDFKRNGIEKLFTGGCLGMTWAGDRLVVLTSDGQLIAMNRRYQVLSRTKHNPKLDMHGIVTLDEHMVLVVETAINAIGCYETERFTRIGEIRLNPADRDVHHANDIWLEGNILYVSMFCPYDRWFMDPSAKTGAIVAIDLTGFDFRGRLDINPANHIVASGLYMPHTVMMHDGQLVYCDSMTFRAVVGNTAIQVAGFTRGLAITGDTIFIGQSRMRHVLRIPHEFSNCCLDGGIHVYHPEFRISRFAALPAQQVYQILVIPPDHPGAGGGSI